MGWEDAAIGIGTAVGNAAGSYIFGEFQQKQQLRGQKKALEQQNAAQMDMWNRTNYKAQVKHMKDAGLNPGLMYGMGGGGGVTAGSGSAMPSQGSASFDIGSAALLKAQIENINADTANKEGDAANKPKVGANLDAETENILQNTKNQKVIEAGLQLDNALKSIEVSYQGETLKDRMESIKVSLDSAKTQLGIIKNQKDISDATKGVMIKQVFADYATTILQQEATRAGIRLTNAQVDQVRKEISQMDKYLEIAIFEANTGKDLANTAHDNMITGAKRLEFDKSIHNVTDATRLTVETVVDVVDMAGEWLIGKGLGKALKQSQGQQKQEYKPRYRWGGK